ncbi:MAG: NAD(P)/FAD-dependent oxidoreductase [Oscillospiraceae bacterium]|jgi:hypothetical protein
MHYDTIIIGGGASGLFASIILGEAKKSVLVLEHNKIVGKKLLITGKGRCNLTNNCTYEEVLKNIPTNSKFMFSSLNRFSPADTIDFFEASGVRLKTERGNRVFPESDKAAEIVSALEKRAKKAGVRFIFEKAVELIIEDGIVSGVKTEKSQFSGNSVIVATGGKSYSGTGSAGDGYAFAKQAGHNITKLVPSLVPVVSEDSFCAEMMGLALKNVTLSLIDKLTGKALFSELGEMLFTHFGVSGPLVLSASSHIRGMQSDRYTFSIDLKPGLSFEQLDLRILRDFSELQNRNFENSLSKLLPSKMIPVIVRLSGINPDTKVNQITKQQRLKLAELIKAFIINIKAFRPIEEAIITCGGVDVREISPKTMQSKLVKGLYFTGEILDVDAYTGGFNLQIAFSTAYAAASDII